MITLNERAEKYMISNYDFIGSLYQSDGMRQCYLAGATDQQEIDIQRVCKWLDDYFERCFGIRALEFCESAKDEITKIMKGE